MLSDLFSNPTVYLVAAVALGLFVYGVWSGIKTSKEQERLVYSKLSELFETRPERYVVRSLSSAHSSAVGNVTLDDHSVMTSVYSGPHEIFINTLDKDAFLSIPWDRIESIKPDGNKRMRILIQGDRKELVRIGVPWSRDMIIDGWERHQESKM